MDLDVEEGPMRRSCPNVTRPEISACGVEPAASRSWRVQEPGKAQAPRKDITNDWHDGSRQRQSIAVRGRCPAHN
jgi:hypothetical protein